MDPFTAGMLVAGLAVGVPVAVAWDVIAGHVVRGIAVPVSAVAVTVWLWLRTRGRAGIAVDVRTPIIRRRDLPQFTAGGLVAVLAIIATLAGVLR